MLKLLNIVFAGVILVLGSGLYIAVYGMPALFQTQQAKLPLFGMEGLSHTDLTDEIMAVNIFASWCTPCHAEHPFLMSLQQDHDLPIYGIALKDSQPALDQFLGEFGNPYKKIGMDYAGLLTGSLGISGLPETLIVNQDLEIIWRYRGPLTENVLKNELLPLLSKLRNKVGSDV